MIPGYIQKIVDWPLPQTGKQLQQFLGFVGYYRGLIPKIAELTFEMNSMRKHLKPKWTPDTEKKFQTLKAHFTEAPLRSYPDYTSEEPFILDTDWSKTNMAAILSQVQGGEEKFIGAGGGSAVGQSRTTPHTRASWPRPSWECASSNTF